MKRENCTFTLSIIIIFEYILSKKFKAFFINFFLVWKILKIFPNKQKKISKQKNTNPVRTPVSKSMLQPDNIQIKMKDNFKKIIYLSFILI